MHLKKLISLLLIITSGITVYAQDYFVVKEDTTFCSKIDFSTTGQGYLNSMKYTDENGEVISIEGRKNVPDVSTFFQDGVSIDKTPLKANKPDSYIRYTAREVDGKLKIYLVKQRYSVSEHYTGPVGIYRFYLRLPDGSYYKINNKDNLKKYIKPYLLKCIEFKNEYQGDFSTLEEPFIEMIVLYNSLCE